MKVRQDAWSHEDDLLLAETVLRYIREGGTQLAAFEEVGDKLNRTSAACGFRWNAEVRSRYDQAIAIAKKQRKEKTRALDKSNKEKKKQIIESAVPSVSFEENFKEQVEFSTELLPPSPESITIADCITFLTNLRNQDHQADRLQSENKRLKKEKNDLQLKNKELEKKFEQLSQQQAIIQEDYQALVQIMDRARRMVMFDELDEQTLPPFRMDKNGNLEQIAE